MGAGTRWVEHAGRALEVFRRGRWVSGRADEPACFLLLFGASGREWAEGIPPRETLMNLAPRELRLVSLVDEPGTLGLMLAKGHPAICVTDMLHAEEKPNRTSDLALGVCKALFTRYRPVDALVSACFAAEFPRARRFMEEFVGQVSPGRGSGFAPRFIAGEMPLDHAKLVELVNHLGIPLKLLVRGAPPYFDHDQYLGAVKDREICYLGWRLAADAARESAWNDARASVFMDIEDWGLRREAEARLGEPARSRGIPVIARWRAGELMDEQLPRISSKAAGGVLITDGASPLLRHLSKNTPVILLRARGAGPVALARISFFEGRERWPVFTSVGELARALEAEGLEGILRPYRDRRCDLERETGPTFEEGFIKEIYLPIASGAAG